MKKNILLTVALCAVLAGCGGRNAAPDPHNHSENETSCPSEAADAHPETEKKSDPDLIAVQDGVRPLGTAEMIRRVVETAIRYGAAIPVVEPVDSFRELDAGSEQAADPRSHPVDRTRLRIVQTPQVFRSWLLREAYGAEFRSSFTDDASVVEAAGYPVSLAPGERSNLKLTTPEDFAIAEAILAARQEAAAEAAEAAEAAANDRRLEQTE